MSDLYDDPYDCEIGAGRHLVWRRPRDAAPLDRNDRYDFWAVSRFTDAYHAGLKWKAYGSARGTVLEMIEKIPSPAR